MNLCCVSVVGGLAVGLTFINLTKLFNGNNYLSIANDSIADCCLLWCVWFRKAALRRHAPPPWRK